MFFPDVHASFKFSTIVFGGPNRRFDESRCAFYLHRVEELDDPVRQLTLTAEDFALVNPNTGATPIFRTRRDADITKRIYRANPVLVQRSELNPATNRRTERKAWPVKYVTMFHMTNDSKLFHTHAELEKQGFASASLNRWRRGDGEAVPLYEGKMLQMFDHRAADVVLHGDNLHRAAQPRPIAAALKEQHDRYPIPQFFVFRSETSANPNEWALGFKEITAPTNARTMIATLLPGAGFGNKVPVLLPQGLAPIQAARAMALVVGNLNCFAFDFVLRQKLQGQTINLFILEQLPVIAAERFEALIGGVNIADFVREQVLHLSYTAHDLAPFARDLGHVNDDGSVKPPFVWNVEDRRARMALLDGLFMHLYGLDEDDAAYILDTFPIVREQDVAAFGHYRTKADVLAQRRAIESGVLRVMPGAPLIGKL